MYKNYIGGMFFILHKYHLDSVLCNCWHFFSIFFQFLGNVFHESGIKG
jgi:hypothetical protein